MPQIGLNVGYWAKGTSQFSIQSAKRKGYKRSPQCKATNPEESLLPSITESVDSVCRDDTDMPYVAIQTETWKSLLKQQL